jgi:16S rRNA (uracil1498-N3)-methyltransferase
MARRRFFVDRFHNSRAVIEGEDARHLRQVLRAEVGQLYELSDNHRVYLAEVESVHRDRVEFRTVEELAAEAPPVRLTLLLALIKFDRFEWAIEKATELGVEAVIPVVAARSEKGLEKAAAKRLERWRKIARESSQQARRARLPKVLEPVVFGRVITGAPALAYILEEQPGALSMLRALPKLRHPEDSVWVLAGPEGGWTDEERVRVLEAGWTPISLGPNILRAETAAIAALALAAGAWLEAASVD